MPSYWWQCGRCGNIRTFDEAVGTGVVTWLWDALARGGWDQGALARGCPQCGNAGSSQITHHFPRKERETVSVVSIVGLPEGTYLPMAWITRPQSAPSARWCHFNYMEGRSNWGLNKPAVLTGEAMRRLLALLHEKAGFDACGPVAAALGAPDGAAER